MIDDLIIWWWDDELFWVLPNALNHARVMSAFAAQPDCSVTDLQTTTMMIAVQGPDAPQILEGVLGEAPGRYRTIRVSFQGGHRLDGRYRIHRGTGWRGIDRP